MISNFIIAVKLHKHTKRDSDYSYVTVEYETPEEADNAIEELHSLRGVVLEKTYTQNKALLKDSYKKSPQSYKTKVYLGNLPEETTEETLKDIVEGKFSTKNVFISKKIQENNKNNKKYAFLEFENEMQRNVALGVLEHIKQEGALGFDVVISPAYPNTQAKKAHKSSL